MNEEELKALAEKLKKQQAELDIKMSEFTNKEKKHTELLEKAKYDNETSRLVKTISKREFVEKVGINKEFADYFVNENRDKLVDKTPEEIEMYVKQERDSEKNKKFFKETSVDASGDILKAGEGSEPKKVEYYPGSTIKKIT